MRSLGISMKGANGSTGLVNIWNVWETQTMVFISFMLQLFLLATGSLRRHKTNGVLKALIWLAYVGADFVALYVLGLFSQYEDRYRCGRESFGDTLPLLWVPFLLVHLGGQDSITAFSLEDNNLWLRHLLILATQSVLALYVFWKSFHRIHYSILVAAMFLFVSGIIKYGERVWALKSASRNGLGDCLLVKFNSGENNMNQVYPSKESYALQTVLLIRGFFVGRTMLQLGDGIRGKFVVDFKSYERGKEMLEIVLMEFGMMFDLLYTKANVLQRWTGVLFRCASQTLMVAAFLLFLISEKGAHNHNRVNVAITYTLFAGAMFMEIFSIAVVMASPWTRAHLNENSFLHGICSFAMSVFKAVQCDKGHQTLSSTSMGQLNLTDYCIAMKYKPSIMSKAICAIGLDKQWRNLWYVHHHRVYDAGRAGEGIISGVMEIFDRPTNEWFRRPLSFVGRRLNFILNLPFEHALYRLHIYTDWHITRHFAQTNTDVILRLKEECMMLSNYMMYLMVVHASMLPVSSAAEDLERELLKRVSKSINGHEGAWSKMNFLEEYTRSGFEKYPDSGSPFEPEGSPLKPEESLKDIKEMWLRLLMYVAGKCRGELHARQLGEGGELITFVWLVMVHHGLGDVSKELILLTSNDPCVLQPGSAESITNSQWILRQDKPCYAFDFCDDEHSQQAAEASAGVLRQGQQVQVARVVTEHIVPLLIAKGWSEFHNRGLIGPLIHEYLTAETQQDVATGKAPVQDEGTSDEAKRVDTATPSEIVEQGAVITALGKEGS